MKELMKNNEIKRVKRKKVKKEKQITEEEKLMKKKT